LVSGIYEGITLGIKALINGIGEAFQAVVQAIKDLFNGVGEAVKEGAGKAGDTVKEIFTLGFADTATYGDTPYAIKAGPEGMTANFAPNDFIIASQTKSGLLKQAVEAMGGALSSMGGMGMPQMIPSAGGATSSTINLAVNADGRLLDQITVNALEKGNAPRLEKRLQRGSGAKVGFDRGRYSNYTR
jgi:hypothetical protein